MKTYYPILKLLLPLILGIVVSDWTGRHYAVTYFVGPLLIVILIILVIAFVTKSYREEVFSFLTYTGLVLIGFFIHQSGRANRLPDHFSEIEGEFLVGELLAVQPAKSTDKCELEILKVMTGDIGYTVTGKLLAYIDTNAASMLKAGDQVLFSSGIHPIENTGNPGEFNAKRYWANQGIFHQTYIHADFIQVYRESEYGGFAIFSRLNTSIQRVLESHLDGDALALAKGILLGDKSSIRTDLRDAFSGAGAMHLLAVSGLHVGIFLVLLQWVIRTFFRYLPKWAELTVLLLILWTYAGITGFSASVNRSVLMFSFVAIGMLYGKQQNSINSLLASAFVLLLIAPEFLFDIGFQLSYLAMLGIFLFSGSIENAVYLRNSFLHKVWQGTSVALAAQLGTFPLTMYYFNQFPNYFLLTNLGLMIFSGILLGVALGLIVTGPIPFVGSFIALLLTAIIYGLVYFIEWISGLPFALTRGIQLEIWEIIVMYAILGAFFVALANKQKNVLKTALGIAVLLFVFETVKWFDRREDSDMFILNHPTPMMFVRKGVHSEIILFSNWEKAEEKAQFLRRSLENYFGVNISTRLIRQNQFILTEASLGLKVNKDKSYIHFEELDYWFVLNDYFDINLLTAESKVIAGNRVSEKKINLIRSQSINVLVLKESGAIRLL